MKRNNENITPVVPPLESVVEPIDAKWELIDGMWVKTAWQIGPREESWTRFLNKMLFVEPQCQPER